MKNLNFTLAKRWPKDAGRTRFAQTVGMLGLGASMKYDGEVGRTRHGYQPQ